MGSAYINNNVNKAKRWKKIKLGRRLTMEMRESTVVMNL